MSALYIRVDPPIPLETEKGFGFAHFMGNLGLENSLYWVVFLEDGQIWNCPNEKVRAVINWSAYRENPEKPIGNV